MATYTLRNSTTSDIILDGLKIPARGSATTSMMTAEIVEQIAAGRLTASPLAPSTMDSLYVYNGTDVDAPAISSGQIDLVPAADAAASNANFAAIALALQVLDGRVSALEARKAT